ncbi:von Willebrand factor A domain-containing protein 5A-like [Gopherus flavomarginatus]|uniref:von Willebrand factor A domain-containing protein 5A-like n=1 Tax=Gopherus flavomarginatus TaxID=286002 RepID=UPI0021CBDAAD|nr:von Willebrand factor A domain-containing protein 5A-like [Gopherus flavomarginatus]
MGSVTLQYRIQDQTYKETLQFPLQPQDGDRLPVHRLAAKSLLLELEGAVDTRSEGDRHQVLETSLSSGVVCSLTAYVGVDTERGQPVQGPLVRRDIPLTAFRAAPRRKNLLCSPMGRSPSVPMIQAQGPSRVSVDCAMACNFDNSSDVQVESRRPLIPLCDTHPQGFQREVQLIFPAKAARSGPRAIQKFSSGFTEHMFKKYCKLRAPPETTSQKERAPEESPLLRLVSLQNADGSWDLDPQLAAALGVSETDTVGRMPSKDMAPSIWATVLAVVWLHSRAMGQRDEWELLEAKAVSWVRGQAGPQLSECLEAANTLLGCSVGPAVFRL